MNIHNKDCLEIASAQNGYILKSFWIEDVNEHGREDIQSEILVFNYETEDQEKEALRSLLITVVEKLGVSYDKFAKNNLNITWDMKGSHYYDPTKNPDYKPDEKENA